MSVVMHDAALRHLLRSQDGPVGRYVDRKSRGVARRSRLKASGRPGPNVRTGDLRREIRARLVEEADGVAGLIGSDARHNGLAYPGLIESGGVSPSGVPYRYPFLEPALAEEFGFTFKGA